MCIFEFPRGLLLVPELFSVLLWEWWSAHEFCQDLETMDKSIQSSKQDVKILDSNISNIQIPKLKNHETPDFSMSGRLVSTNVDDFELPFQDNIKWHGGLVPKPGWPRTELGKLRSEDRPAMNFKGLWWHAVTQSQKCWNSQPGHNSWAMTIGGCIKSVRISPIALLACYIELMTMQKKTIFPRLASF